MVRPKRPFSIDDEKFNYCISAWNEFTKLTNQEIENYRQLVKYYTGKNLFVEHKKKRNREYKTKQVYCRETRQFYSSITECANTLNSRLDTISKAIKRKTKVQGLYTIEEI